MSGDPSRRLVLGGLAAGAVLSSPLVRAAEAFRPGPPPGPKSAPSRPVVAVARRPGLATAGGAIDPRLLEAALGAAVARAAGESTPVAAMRRLFRPTDVVGIKVNCLGGRGVSTRPEVALQLAAFLQAAGVPADRIYVWDRTDRELRAAGYALDRGRGVRVFGTNEDFDERLVEWGPSASRFDRVLADGADRARLLLRAEGPRPRRRVAHDEELVRRRPQPEQAARRRLRSVHPPPRRLPRHSRQAAPQRRGRRDSRSATAGRAEPRAGPGRSAASSPPPTPWRSTRSAGRCIEARRKEVGLPPLAAEGREPGHIAGAAKLGLGVADLARDRAGGGVT